MKKIIAFILSVVMCFALVACGNDAEKDDVESDSSDIITESNQETEASKIEAPIIDSKTESKYDDSLKWLEEYFDYGMFDAYYKYVDSKNANDICAYIYNFLGTLGDYKESKEYLSHFKVFSDKLLRSYTVEVDSFGQETENVYATYVYNKQGKKPYSYESMVSNVDRLLGESSYISATIKRNDDDKITGAEWYDGEMLYCKAQIECDNNGNIVKAHLTYRDGTEWTNTYSYDSENRMTEANIEFEFNGTCVDNTQKSHQYKYAYDDHGNQVLIFTQYDILNYDNLYESKTSSWSSEYTYDKKDNLIKYFEQNGDGSRSETEIYSSHKFNEKGQLISVEVTKGEKTFTLFYEYGDYYYYE